jgi:hypothetical protein
MKIRNHHATKIELRLFELDATSAEARQIGAPVTLAPGLNDVSPEFWEAWNEQNQGGALASMFTVEE